MVDKLLIANRGEIARRVARTAREMGIRTVAIYSDPDEASPHVRESDEAVRLTGSTPQETYLNGDRILEVASTRGVDAIHPGYGFLSENADFARMCEHGGVTFVGPSADVIATLGNKLRSKKVAERAGFQVLTSHSMDDLASESLPFPLLVKATAGGGGKGMRVVERPAALEEAVARAQQEAEASFGDGRVFLEPYLPEARHVEIQILGDTWGAIVHLGERECSIQRRHQKLIEMSPSPAVDDRLRTEMCEAAIRVGHDLHYTSVGTVECLLDQDGGFWFLEVNARLQVEHGVTELAWRLRDGSPLDLVRLQILIARGEQIPFEQDDIVLANHAIEARLYAEDPARDYMPSVGKISVWAIPERRRVRVDAGVEVAGRVSEFYDAMLAKVLAIGPNHAETSRLLARTLEDSRIHGVRTNRDLLVSVLLDQDFLSGAVNTEFLASRPELLSREQPPDLIALNASVAAIIAAGRRTATQSLIGLGAHWRNNGSRASATSFQSIYDGSPIPVTYRQLSERRWETSTDVGQFDLEVHAWPAAPDEGTLDVTVAGVRLQIAVTWSSEILHLDSAIGNHALRETPRFSATGIQQRPGDLLAPMPATVTAVHAVPGMDVTEGDLLVVLEAMKMELNIYAPYSGRILAVSSDVGATVAAGQPLVDLERSDDGLEGVDEGVSSVSTDTR